MSLGATVTSLPQAMRMIKRMDLQGYEWGMEYRDAGRAAIKQTLEETMRGHLARHLEEFGRREGTDRRNGTDLLPGKLQLRPV